MTERSYPPVQHLCPVMWCVAHDWILCEVEGEGLPGRVSLFAHRDATDRVVRLEWDNSHAVYVGEKPA